MYRLAAVHGLSQATAYRCLPEAIDVVADRQPDLHDVLHGQIDAGAALVCQGRHPHPYRPGPHPLDQHERPQR